MVLRKPRGDFREYPMKRRFSETSIMSEYHSRKPYFIGVNDDGPTCPNNSSYPNDEMWKKFELFLTPPSSPEHKRENDLTPPKPDPIVSALTSDAALAAALNILTEVDLDTNGGDFAEEEALQDPVCPEKSCDCASERKLIKDCMWNGFGHNRTRRVSSPVPAHSPCHANGCVDPRNIFPYPVGQPTCCESQKKRRFPSPAAPTLKHRPTPATDGAETPSDSDEEIDVVTVESKQNINLLKAKAAMSANGTTNGATAKIMATLVPKENGELTLVTNTPPTNFASGRGKNGLTTMPELKELKNGDLDRGRPRNKQILLCAANGNSNSIQEIAMLLDNSQRAVTAIKDGQKVKLQLKNLPRTFDDVTKRRKTTDSCCVTAEQGANTLMRLANPKSVMQRDNSVSPVPASGVKRRILSLDGISFSATTGARQYTTDYNRQKDSAPPSAPGSALRSAQENAISITPVRGKPKLKVVPATTIARVKIEPEPIGMQAQLPTSPQSKRKRKQDVVSTSSASGSDNEQIRAAHNVLERQRREGLRASFHTLRDNVPELQNMERTPKVNILNKARDYCYEVTEKEKALVAEKERLRRRQEHLRLRLQRLQTSVDLSEASGSELDFDLVSDNDDQTSEDDALLSPESSLPPSLPPSPNHCGPASNGYYIARRLSGESCKAMPQPEVVFRLETTCDTNSRQNQGKRKLVLSQALFPGSADPKQVKYSAELQALIASLQHKSSTNLPVLTSQNSGGLSDGYEEPYDSEEDSARFEMAGNQIGHVIGY